MRAAEHRPRQARPPGSLRWEKPPKPPECSATPGLSEVFLSKGGRGACKAHPFIYSHGKAAQKVCPSLLPCSWAGQGAAKRSVLGAPRLAWHQQEGK